MQLSSLWSCMRSAASWVNGWSLRARLQRLSYHLPSHSLHTVPGTGPHGHGSGTCSHAVLVMTALRACLLRHCHPFSHVIRQLLGAWLTQTSVLDARGKLLQAQILPLGSLYSSRGGRVHIWTCRKNTCKAAYRQVQINVVWTSRWLQPTRENLVPRVRCNKASLSMPSSVVQHT